MNTELLIQLVILVIPIAIIYFLYDSLGQKSGYLILILFNILRTVYFYGFDLKNLVLVIILSFVEGIILWKVYTKTNTFFGYCLLSVSIIVALVIIISIVSNFIATYHIFPL